jgi:hypothetical protein
MSGLVGESDFASNSLASMRKSPAVSTISVRDTHLCGNAGRPTPVHHGHVLIFSWADKIAGPRDGMALSNVQVSQFICPLSARILKQASNKQAPTAKDVYARIAAQLSYFS